MKNDSIGLMGILMIVMMGAMVLFLLLRRRKSKSKLFKKKEQLSVEPQFSDKQQSELQ